MNIIDELEQRARVTAHVKLDRKTMLALLAVVETVRDLAARCESAEQCMVSLTADHHSTPNYVRGFEMAGDHFHKYPMPALDGLEKL